MAAVRCSLTSSGVRLVLGRRGRAGGATRGGRASRRSRRAARGSGGTLRTPSTRPRAAPKTMPFQIDAQVVLAFPDDPPRFMSDAQHLPHIDVTPEGDGYATV